MKKIELNSKKYAIRKEYLNNHKLRGQMLLCKSKTFRYVDGKVMVVYSEIGNSKNEFTEATHTIFDCAEEAFAIMSGEQYNPKEIVPSVKERKIGLREYEIAAMKSLVASTKTFDEQTMVNIAKLSKVLAKELYQRNS